MIDAFSREILNRRPNIQFVGPRSLETIPDPSPAEQELDKPARIQQLINGLDNLNTAAEIAEELIAARAKDVTLTLDLDDPEDFATAQATARQFPELAEEILPGVRVVKKITFPMYQEAMKCLKKHGRTVGTQNQIPAVVPGPQTNFGGIQADSRPQMNSSSVIMPPVPIPAYLIATIPLLFLMLHPLRLLYTNTKIVGHIHNVTTPAPGSPVGPGIPVNPA